MEDKEIVIYALTCFIQDMEYYLKERRTIFGCVPIEFYEKCIERAKKELGLIQNSQN